MRFIFSNNPIDRLSCWYHNKVEEFSQIKWITGERKQCECVICGNKMDSYKDIFSPMQCGWVKIKGSKKYICHSCLCHRDFKKYISLIDEEVADKYASK